VTGEVISKLDVLSGFSEVYLQLIHTKAKKLTGGQLFARVFKIALTCFSKLDKLSLGSCLRTQIIHACRNGRTYLNSFVGL
jgi:hypothetical protein